ncbi:MAG: precorrin-6A reductase [Spirochaetaceae bacterium]|nr:precorrin-6A reductase [Spirochaetaceae bacterium]
MSGNVNTKRVFVFAGTTEGRLVIQRLLERGDLRVTAFTATCYGSALLSGMACEIRAGRLAAAEMEREIARARPLYVVDATHPFAVHVSKNIRAACAATGTRCLRLKRDVDDKRDVDGGSGGCIRVQTAEEAAACLEGRTGGIFLATGIKEAAPFARPSLRERVFIRVLPMLESLERCAELGFPAKNIIAMQGPFSEALNAALFRQSGAAWLVTKQSGETGGFGAKIAAAEDCGLTAVVIAPPVEDAAAEGCSLEEILALVGAAAPPSESSSAAAPPAASPTLPVASSAPPSSPTPPATSLAPLPPPPAPAEKSVVLVSAGPGAAALFTGEAAGALEESGCVIGARRLLELHAKIIGKKEQAALFKADEIAAFIEKSAERRFAVLLSGDGGFFSLARTLVPVLRERNWPFTLISGVSSLALLAYRLGICWDDITTVSLHGRGGNGANLVTGAVSRNRKTFFLTDEKTTPAVICTTLAENGLGGVVVTVGENLSLPNEQVRRGPAASFVDTAFSTLSVVLAENPAPLDDSRGYSLADTVFTRGKVPMTKAEIRVLALARLRIGAEDVVYDVGAGTGAFTSAAALSAKWGRVFAIEREAAALELIRQNTAKLNIHNVEIIAGEAPDALEALPPPQAVFIGGSGGRLESIVDAVLAKNPRCRIVITALTLETIACAAAITRRANIQDVKITQVAVSQAQEAGAYRLMRAANPVFIVSFSGGGAEDGGGAAERGGGAAERGGGA